MVRAHVTNEKTPEGYGEASPFKGSRQRRLLHRAVPVSESLPEYRVHTARGDLLAAVTVAALAIPSAMAYAELAGVTPIAGLYALLLPTVAYALLGSSRQLIVGPEGSLAALVAAAVLPLAAAGSGEAAELARRSRCSSAPASSWPDCCGLDGSPTTSRARC